MEVFGFGVGSLAAGFVLGTLFGNFVWQFIKHTAVAIYQGIKHALFG